MNTGQLEQNYIEEELTVAVAEDMMAKFEGRSEVQGFIEYIHAWDGKLTAEAIIDGLTYSAEPDPRYCVEASLVNKHWVIVG